MEPLDLPESFFNNDAPIEAENTTDAEQYDNPKLELPADLQDLNISLDSGLFEDLDTIFTDVTYLF